MKAGIEASADKLLRISPLQPFFRMRSASSLTVLAYHGITDPQRFASHLDHLLEHARPVGLDEVLAGIRGESLPPRATLITFDDNDRSVLESGAPLLEERSIPALIFVIAGLLDGDQPYWFEEVDALIAAGGQSEEFHHLDSSSLKRALKKVSDDRRLSVLHELRESVTRQPAYSRKLSRQDLGTLESAGFEIGNHSLTHPLLTRCPASKIRDEIGRAHEIIEDAGSRAPRAFAYPNGDHNDEAMRVLTERGYEAGFLFDHQLNRLPVSHPLLISRLRVNSTTSLDRLRTILSGLHPAVHLARGRTAKSDPIGESV